MLPSVFQRPSVFPQHLKPVELPGILSVPGIKSLCRNKQLMNKIMLDESGQPTEGHPGLFLFLNGVQIID